MWRIQRVSSKSACHDSALVGGNPSSAQGIRMRVCQNAHFGFPLEGVSEWPSCKALRMRAQGVYWSTWPSPNPIATQQIGYYDTPPLPRLPEKTTNGDNHWTTIEQPLNNHWTTIEQPLNSHWTIIEQTLFKPCSTHVQTKTLLSGKVLFFSAKLPPDNNRCIGTRLGTTLYVN